MKASRCKAIYQSRLFNCYCHGATTDLLIESDFLLWQSYKLQRKIDNTG